MKKLLPAIIAALTAILISCSHTPAPVPRPDARPRPNVHPAVYKSVTFKGVDLSLNATARIDTVPNGITAVYSRPDANIYLTVVDRIDNLERLRTSRLERMHRNVPSSNVQIDTFTNEAGFSVITVRALGASQTPLQLYAENARAQRVVSATAFINTEVNPANLDSLAPYIDALEADIHRLADSISIAK